MAIPIYTVLPYCVIQYIHTVHSEAKHSETMHTGFAPGKYGETLLMLTSPNRTFIMVGIKCSN